MWCARVAESVRACGVSQSRFMFYSYDTMEPHTLAHSSLSSSRFGAGAGAGAGAGPF